MLRSLNALRPRYSALIHALLLATSTRESKHGRRGPVRPAGSKLARKFREYRESTGRNYTCLIEAPCYGRRSERS